MNMLLIILLSKVLNDRNFRFDLIYHKLNRNYLNL